MRSRILTAVAVSLAGFLPAGRGAAADLAPYATVEVAPVGVWAYLAKISLSAGRFVRKDGVYSAAYKADVFPFLFYGEEGVLRVEFPDGALLRLARGETVGFTGRAIRTDGRERALDGRIMPGGAASGRIKVRLVYNRAVILVFNTTYRIPGLAPAAPARAPSRP